MKRLLLGLTCAALISSHAFAQTNIQQYRGPVVNASGQTVQGPVDVTAAAPLPVTVKSVSSGTGAVTDRSGTIATGGTRQQAAAANTARAYLFCENPSATVSGVTAESLFINVGANATSTGTSYELTNLGTLTFDHNFIPTGTVDVLAATTGHKYVCKEG